MSAQYVYVLTFDDGDGGGHISVYATLARAKSSMERFIDSYGIREAFDASEKRSYLARENSSVFTADFTDTDNEGLSIGIAWMRVYP